MVEHSQTVPGSTCKYYAITQHNNETKCKTPQLKKNHSFQMHLSVLTRCDIWVNAQSCIDLVLGL